MQASARDNYLETEVMTAAPQKIQLMLVEAAIRSAETAREKWQSGEDEQACKTLIRAQEIVGEMLAGLNREIDADLVGKVASVYLFVFRNLMEANYERNETKLDDAIRLLGIERETWRQVCEKLGSKRAPDGRSPAETSGQPVAPPHTAPQSLPLADLSPSSDTPGLSLEA